MGFAVASLEATAFFERRGLGAALAQCLLAAGIQPVAPCDDDAGGVARDLLADALFEQEAVDLAFEFSTANAMLRSARFQKSAPAREALPATPDKVDYRSIRNEIRRMVGWIVNSD